MLRANDPMTAPDFPLLECAPVRDPQPLLAQTLAQWDGRSDCWVFGYGSLIWRPDLAFVERRAASVHGWHRAFQMLSRVNRGTPHLPGLVFALISGGMCHGVVYRIARRDVRRQLQQLWAREMPTGVYDPRWLHCRTPAGPVAALAFTLSRRSPNYTGAIDDERLLQILRHARGRYGTTLEYLLRTADALHAAGVPDRSVDRLVALVRRHALG